MKPVPSSSAAPAAMLAVTPSVPGTETDAGALSGGPCASAKETAHEPAPPPASASETEIVLLSPAFSSPNETLDGEAKRSGAFARTRLMRPPPPRSGVAWTERASSTYAGSPVSISADLICATVQVGCCCLSSAAEPATCGDAMLVPLNAAQVPSRSGTEETTLTPGAATSGFNCRE